MVTLYPKKGHLIIGLVLSVFFIGLSGCAGKGSSVEQVISLNITPYKNANLGEPFYIAIYSTNEEQFLTTSYFDIASKVLKTNQNKNLLTFQLVLPGKSKRIRIHTKKNNSLGIYALFTHPSDQWKILLVKPLKEKYDIILEKNKIILKTKHWWEFLW